MKKVYLSCSKKNRLISNLMSPISNMNESETFILKGSNEFTSRTDNIFGELSSLEKAHETWVSKNHNEHLIKNDERSGDTKETNSAQLLMEGGGNDLQSNLNPCELDSGVFKKPKLTRLRKRNKGISKFWKPIKKWTKYSLEDIPLSSNSTNTAVALAFINELRSRKSPNKMEEETDKKIVFTKPEKNKSLTLSTFESQSKSETAKISSLVKLHHLENEFD